jgi:tRNA nucleotidyltransferase (CCA-adding enzyme)
MRRFEEDALRILRAFRFASKLGFDIEEKTLAAARERKELLRNISAERKTAELEGILLGKYVKKALELMKAAGVIEIVAPAFNLDKQRMDGIESLPCDFACRVSFCLIGGKDTDKYVSSLRLSNAISSQVRKLVSMGSEPLAAENDRELRRLMARAGDELEYLIEIRRHLGQSTEGIAERARAIRERGDCLCLSDLDVDGGALSQLGIRGKSIGNTLSGLLEAVLDDPKLNRREWLLAEAARLNENGREN